MTKVTLSDENMVAVLNTIQQQSELCDASGRVLGFYTPNPAVPERSYRGVKSPYSREQLDQWYQEALTNGKPLSEFWAEMQRKHPDKFP